MKKLLIALAEMFSAFSAKLHDMSEEQGEYVTSWDVRNIIKELPDSLDAEDVREIVREELDTENIGTDDITGLDRYVSDAIDEYDFSDKISERNFYLSVRDLVWTYANSRGIDTNVIYVCSEEWAMQRYLEERAKEWKANVEEQEARKKARIIAEYEKHRQTVENAGVPPTEPTDDGKFVPTITLGDGTTTIKI